LGHSSNHNVAEDDDSSVLLDNIDFSDLPDRIMEENVLQFHHKPVPVPKHKCPFEDPADLKVFKGALLATSQDNLLPEGYGLLPEEWDDDYPAYEIIRSGRRGSKELRVSLPHFVWKPRADLWGRALFIMNSILDS
jgi:hypothetical protein